MRKKQAQSFIIVSIILLLICGAAVFSVYKKSQGNTNHMSLDEYYELDLYGENSIPLIINTQILPNKAYEIDGKIYVEQSVVSTMIDSKIYWDTKASSVIVATPDKIVTVQPEKQSYLVDNIEQSADMVYLKKVTDTDYAIALDFVKTYANVEYVVEENPKRVVLKSAWGTMFDMVEVTDDDELRVKADKNSEILTEVKKGDLLYVLTENFQTYVRYIQVMTEDGIVGFVRNAKIGKPYGQIMENDYQGMEYTQLKMDGKVNLGWLQVSNMTANNNLKNIVRKTDGLNVLCPTWFTIKDELGNITSYASKDFVDFAHKCNKKVWVLVDDFSEVKLIDVISDTERRDNLVTDLVVNTVKCGADGINVDFEHITEESSVHYIQFLRELRIKCHKNNLVLSVDSYVPLSYNAHYNIDIQNEFVDYVVIMAYDEYHSKSTESGSVASIGYTQTAIEKSLEKVDKERLIISVPFYSRLWGLDQSGAITSVETLGMQEAYDRVIKEGGKFTWDEGTKQYFAAYEYQGKTFNIWLENKQSINEKVALIAQSGVAGLGSWRLGYETSDVWNVISSYMK